MTRRPPHYAAFAAFLLLPLVGVACGSSSDGGDGGAATPGHVNVIDNKFDPGTVEIAVGDTVTWEFKGAVKHNVTGPGFNGPTQKSGTYEHTFNSAGTFKYNCTIHPGMKGTVKVS